MRRAAFSSCAVRSGRLFSRGSNWSSTARLGLLQVASEAITERTSCEQTMQPAA